MTDPELTDRILRQGRALVRAIGTLGTIPPSDPFKHVLACLLIVAYQRQLRAIAVATPVCVSEEILSVSERTGDDRAVLWLSANQTREQ